MESQQEECQDESIQYNLKDLSDSDLTFLLNKYASLCGLNSKLKQISKYSEEIEELSKTLLSNGITLLPAGSSFEGLSLPDKGILKQRSVPQSDMDFMLIGNNFHVIENRNSVGVNDLAAFIDTSDTHPGYTRIIRNNGDSSYLDQFVSKEYISAEKYRKITFQKSYVADFFNLVRSKKHSVSSNKPETELKIS